MRDRTNTPGRSDDANAVPSIIDSAGPDLSAGAVPTPTRITHCSCGRPARELLDGGRFNRTGYCGTPRPPADPCDCGQGAERHDRSVCHVYGCGQAFELLLRSAVLEYGIDDSPRLVEDGDDLRLTRPAWIGDDAWKVWAAATSSWWGALLDREIDKIRTAGTGATS